MTNNQKAHRDVSVLRRLVADLDALDLPGDYDLQQAALLTLSQLQQRAHKRLQVLAPEQKPRANA